jgi:hypothetical protein
MWSSESILSARSIVMSRTSLTVRFGRTQTFTKTTALMLFVDDYAGFIRDQLRQACQASKRA